MPSFKIVNKPDDINVSDKFRDAAKFSSKDKFITHKGHEYKIISKKERDFSSPERIGRAALGVLAVISTFGLGLINKNFRKSVGKLFTKEQETIRFAVPTVTTQSLLADLEGTSLKTEEELIYQFAKDYNGLQGTLKDKSHITIKYKIINKTIKLPPIPGLTGRDVNEDLIPKKLEDMFPKEIKTYFGDKFPLMAPKLVLLLQQGIAADFMLRAPKLIDDPILGTTFWGENTYPYFEFSKVDDEIFLLIKGKGFLAEDPSKKHKRDYDVSMLVNLTNPDASVQMTYTNRSLWQRLVKF